MNKLVIELTDGELAALERVTNRDREEHGVPDLTVEDSAASAVRFMLMTLREKF